MPCGLRENLCIKSRLTNRFEAVHTAGLEVNRFSRRGFEGLT